MKQCRICGTQNEDAAIVCKQCGAQLSLPTPDTHLINSISSGSAWGTTAKSSPSMTVEGFHRGYASTLKVLTNIACFGLPIIAFLFVMMTSRGNGLVMLGGLVACGLMAFVLWVLLSYQAKMFDLTSKNAMINSKILEELRKGGKKE